MRGTEYRCSNCSAWGRAILSRGRGMRRVSDRPVAEHAGAWDGPERDIFQIATLGTTFVKLYYMFTRVYRTATRSRTNKTLRKTTEWLGGARRNPGSRWPKY